MFFYSDRIVFVQGRGANMNISKGSSVVESSSVPKKMTVDAHKAMPIIAVCIGQTIWGFSYLFTKTAMNYASPDQLLSVRFIIATIIMTFMLFTGKYKVSLKGKKLKSLILLGIMEPLNFYFESYGILYTNATLAGVIIAVVPVVSILLAVLLLKEYPTKRQTFYCFLPIIGVIIITISSSSLGIAKPFGIFLLFCTCITSALYRVINRKSAEEYSAFERTYIVLIVSSIVFTVSALRQTGWSFNEYIKPVFNTGFIVPVLILSVFCSVTACMLVNYAAGEISVAKLSTFGTLTTVWSMFSGVIFLKEPITVMSFFGSLLILIGIWKVTKEKQK